MSWLMQPDVRQIVIVDWSSRQSLAGLVRLDRRIEVVRVEGESRFHLAAAFNLAADQARHPLLLKLDVDYVLNPYERFVAACPLPARGFITGYWRDAEPFFKQLNGLVYLRTADWRAVEGFDERLVGWGWEDEDLYQRLQQAGLSRSMIAPRKAIAFHIPHDDGVRSDPRDWRDARAVAAAIRTVATMSPFPGRLLAWDLARGGRAGAGRREADRTGVTGHAVPAGSFSGRGSGRGR